MESLNMYYTYICIYIHYTEAKNTIFGFPSIDLKVYFKQCPMPPAN